MLVFRIIRRVCKILQCKFLEQCLELILQAFLNIYFETKFKSLEDGVVKVDSQSKEGLETVCMVYRIDFTIFWILLNIFVLKPKA